MSPGGRGIFIDNPGKYELITPRRRICVQSRVRGLAIKITPAFYFNHYKYGGLEGLLGWDAGHDLFITVLFYTLGLTI